MIDPAHGGEDRGSVLPGKAQEKELTLSLARELRKQLEERGVPTRLLRESDVNPSLEHRAEMANQNAAVIYVAIHAEALGRGIRIYSSSVPSAPPTGLERFLSWDDAQASSLSRSRRLANTVGVEMRKADFQVSIRAAPLPPLHHLLMPAISVEWSPEADDLKPQQGSGAIARLTAALASGIAVIYEASGARP